MRKKIAVLASGGGTNLQALLDAWRSGQFEHAQIEVVISNKQSAKALERAEHAGVETRFVDPKLYKTKEKYDEALLEVLKDHDIDVICLAGYMRILTPVLIKQYAMKILNIHPSLLPSFGGEGMYGHHVHEAVVASGVKYSGCTVHFVDEGTDTGPIILQSAIPVRDHDTPTTLAERVLIEEHRLFPRAVELMCNGCLSINGRRVTIIEKA